MLDAQAIFTQVAHNEAHENWVIVKAKDDARTVVVACAFLAVLIGFPTTILLTLPIPYLFGYTDPNPFPLLLSEPWLILPSLFFWAIILFLVWRSEKNKSDARLMLLPEGIILCDRWGNDQKRGIKSIAYVYVESMELKVMGGTFAFPVAQVRDMSVEEYIEHVQSGIFTFDIVYQGGKKESWTIPLKYYTQPEENKLVAHIVTDYAAFVQQYKVKF